MNHFPKQGCFLKGETILVRGKRENFFLNMEEVKGSGEMKVGGMEEEKGEWRAERKRKRKGGPGKAVINGPF
jgi:hypothetical protein